MAKEWKIEAKPFQFGFLNSKVRFPALVAGIGTGKTLMMLLKIWHFCLEHPDTLALVVRKEFTDLRDSTMKDFCTYFEATVDGNKEYKFKNGSTIMFRHGGELNVLKNINLTIFGIEQAEEFESEESFVFLRDRLRRNNAPLRQGCIIGNVNGDNWIKHLWKDGKLGDAELFEATTFDNEDNLPADFIKDLKRMEAEAPEHFQRYVMNDWSVADDQFMIIKTQWFEKLKGALVPRHATKTIISCDPSAGGDECVIYVIKNSQIIDERIMHESNTMIIAGEILALLRKYEINDAAVDSIGIGRGICDRLIEWKVDVNEINSSERASNPDMFYNIRAEMWFYAAQQILKKDIEYVVDDELRRQLSNVKYKIVDSNGKIKLEPKQDTKERLGRSPDRADAFVYGLWALKDVAEQTPYFTNQVDFSHLMAVGNRGGY